MKKFGEYDENFYYEICPHGDWRSFGILISWYPWFKFWVEIDFWRTCIEFGWRKKGA